MKEAEGFLNPNMSGVQITIVTNQRTVEGLVFPFAASNRGVTSLKAPPQTTASLALNSEY